MAGFTDRQRECREVQNLNHHPFSASCNTLDSTWESIKTTPELPVNHGDTIQLSCQTGYSLAGSDTATCNDGKFDISGGVPPFCLGE